MSESANKKRKEIRDKILKLLKENERMCTKEIAGKVGISPPTASKYLAGLEGEKKVKRHDDQPPYAYWSLNKGSNEEKNS